MYPSVTSIHAALDALRILMRMHRLAADDIGSIKVGVGHMTYVHTAWEYKPAGSTAAQMNMFFGLATMARHGDVVAGDYVKSRLADPALLDFMHRITVVEDPFDRRPGQWRSPRRAHDGGHPRRRNIAARRDEPPRQPGEPGGRRRHRSEVPAATCGRCCRRPGPTGSLNW